MAIATPINGINSTNAARESRLPRTRPASTVNTTPAEMSTNPSMNIVTSSTSSRKWVMASPAEPTGWPASGPPLAIWATNRLARSSDCMCTHALVHISAPAWMALMRATSQTTSAAAIQYTRELSPVDTALKPRPSSQPLSTGNVKNSTNSR